MAEIPLKYVHQYAPLTLKAFQDYLMNRKLEKNSIYFKCKSFIVTFVQFFI